MSDLVPLLVPIIMMEASWMGLPSSSRMKPVIVVRD